MSSWLPCAVLSTDPQQLFSSLLDHIVAYQPQQERWYRFTLISTPKEKNVIDWADCIFDESTSQLTSQGVCPTLFLNLDIPANITSGQTGPMLLDFLRYLRLSRYHPKALTHRNFNLWCSPAVCLSYSSILSFVKRNPRGLVVASPSVRYLRLPLLLSQFSLPPAGIPEASTDEVFQYVNSTQPVNLSSNHELGDIIGPYSILTTLQAAEIESHESLVQLNELLAPQRQKISTDTLHDIQWQAAQRKAADDDLNPSSENLIRILDALHNRAGRYKDPSKVQNSKFLIVDDQSELWGPVWKALWGLQIEWECKSADEVKQLFSDAKKCVESPQDRLEYNLVILDLRLEQGDKERSIETISGYQLIEFIRECDEAIPILVFTSSQRVGLLRKLRIAGADMVCHKPARVENAPNLLETLVTEINLMLCPEFEFLQKAYYALKKQEAHQVGAGEYSFEWALAGWREARQNVRLWIIEKSSSAARLSARSVIRTIGLAAEAIDNRYKNEGNLYIVGLKALRNAASHIGAENGLNTEAAYVAIFLAAEMFYSIDSNGYTIGNTAPLESPNQNKLMKMLGLNRVGTLARRSICSLLQLGSITWALCKEGKLLKWPTIVVDNLSSVEESCLTALKLMRDKHRIATRDLNPFTKQAPNDELKTFHRDYAHFEDWYDSLDQEFLRITN